MLGHGESEREVEQAMDDLREYGVDVVTFGQYLRPTLKHLPVREHVTPARFAALEQRALKKGFLYVASGPLVRSTPGYVARTFAEVLFYRLVVRPVGTEAFVPAWLDAWERHLDADGEWP